MRDAYRTLLLSLLPLLGCDGKLNLNTSEGTGCLAVADSATCPAADDVDPDDLESYNCGADIVEITGEAEAGSNPTGWGDTANEWCCYPVEESNDSECVYGRPFMHAGASQQAATAARPGWGAGDRPVTDGMPAAARDALAAAWRQAALEEHAAVAAFSRLVLELMAFGAPSNLVGWTSTAATEEVRHAERGFQLATAYAGAPVGPEGFPLGASLPLTRDLAAFAAATVREGCIGETLTTLVALSCLARCSDPAVRATLERITEDEQGHARLAWATVRWAVDVGGPEVRAAVAGAFAGLSAERFPLPARLADGPHRDLLVAHGVPTAEMARAAIARGIAEVIEPAARALLQPASAAPQPALRA